MKFFKPKDVNVIVDKTGIVAVFRKSDPPLVWKLDLIRTHSFSFKLEGEEGNWKLGILTPDGGLSNIAKFSSHEDAIYAFETVQSELTKKQYSNFRGLLKFIIIVLIIISVGTFGLKLLSRYTYHYLTDTSANYAIPVPEGIPVPAEVLLKAPASPKSTLGPQPSGVPIPAEDVLKPPR